MDEETPCRPDQHHQDGVEAAAPFSGAASPSKNSGRSPQNRLNMKSTG